MLILRSQGVLLPTTIVGSLPRPAWLRGAVFRATGQSADYIDMEHRAVFEDAVRLAVADQRADGIDIVSATPALQIVCRDAKCRTPDRQRYLCNRHGRRGVAKRPRYRAQIVRQEQT